MEKPVASAFWVLRGKALLFGDNVNTDMLHPSQFYSLDDARVRSGFLQAASGYEQIGASDLSGQIILAGENFGCGSSRETGARVFQVAGIRAIVARSLARIFSRNLRNLGMVALEAPDLRFPEQGTEVEVNLKSWTLRLLSLDMVVAINPLDTFWVAVLQAGGLAQFLGLTPQRQEPHHVPRKS
jgi:3-isopropylmalate dehydratase small subunit